MALKTLTALGQTDGVDVTTTNSDDFGDSALTLVTLGTGSTVKYSSEQAYPAANRISLKITGPTGQQALVQQGGSLAQLFLTGSYYFYFTDYPPVSGRTKIVQFRSSASTGGVTIDSDGFLRCENFTGGTIFTGATQVPLNQWIRIDYAEVADTTTTGTTHFAWFSSPASTSPTESFDATNVNHSTTNITVANVGKVGASTWVTPFYIATLRTQDATGLLGPFGQEKTASSTDTIGITGSTTTQVDHTVTVTDTIGITDTGAPQSLAIGLSVTDTIGVRDDSETLDTANLLARWVADDLTAGGGVEGDRVTAWSEWSDQLPDALAQPSSASQPTLRASVAGLNGHAAVEFDGVGNFLSLNGTALALAQNVSSLVVFCVYKLSDTDVIAGPCDLFAISSGTSAAQHRAALYSHSASLLPQVAGRRLDINSLQSINGQLIPTSHAGILYGRWQYATAYAELYQDGALTASTTTFQSAGVTSNTVSLAGAIGSRASGASEFFPGQIADILVYSDVTTAQRQRIQTYLANTYGLTLNDVIAYSGSVDGLFWDTPIVTDGSVLVDPGGAAVTASAAISAAGLAKVSGSVSVISTFAVSAAGVVARSGAAAAPFTATVSAAGVAAGSNVATRSVTATITSTGNLATTSDMPVTATAAVTAAGAVAGTASGTTRPNVFASSATGAVAAASAASVVTTAAVIAAGTSSTSLNAAVTVAAAVTSSGFVGAGAGAVVGAPLLCTVTAVGVKGQFGAAPLSFAANITGFGSVNRASDAAVALIATVSVTGGGLYGSTVGAAFGVSAAGTMAAASGAALPASALVTATGSRGFLNSAAVSPAASIVVTGSRDVGGDAAFVLAALVLASGAVAGVNSAAVRPAAFAVDTGGVVTVIGGASAPITATTNAAGRTNILSGASVAASAAITVGGVAAVAGPNVPVVGIVTITAAGAITSYAAPTSAPVLVTVIATGRTEIRQDNALVLAAAVTAIGRRGVYRPHPITVGPPRDTFAGYLRTPPPSVDG